MRFIGSALALALLATPLAAAAAPTPVDVYVISRDAKFVGTGVGGVRVTITEAATGEVLAQGVTQGGTGDTDLIMGEREHGTSLITEDTAAFSTSLDLDHPARVRVTAYGPLDYPESAATVTATHWLLPGEPAADDGLILELPGLIVDLHDTPTFALLEEGEAFIGVHVIVRMMCGCPLTPDGLWDSNEFEIEAMVLRDGVEFAQAPLEYAGEASEFEGELLLTQPGTYMLSVRAHQPRTGNTGVIDRVLMVN